MTVYRLRLPRRLSDEQCVEHARRSLAQFDRWRRSILLIHLIGMLVLVAFVVLFTVIIGSIEIEHIPLSWAGFMLGIVLGAYAGLAANQVLHGLALGIFGLRNEELLVKYHDLAQSLSDRGGYLFGNDDKA